MMRGKSWILSPIFDMELVNRVTRNGFDVVGNHNLLVKRSVHTLCIYKLNIFCSSLCPFNNGPLVLNPLTL